MDHKSLNNGFPEPDKGKKLKKKRKMLVVKHDQNSLR